MERKPRIDIFFEEGWVAEREFTTVIKPDYQYWLNLNLPMRQTYNYRWIRKHREKSN